MIFTSDEKTHSRNSTYKSKYTQTKVVAKNTSQAFMAISFNSWTSGTEIFRREVSLLRLHKISIFSAYFVLSYSIDAVVTLSFRTFPGFLQNMFVAFW